MTCVSLDAVYVGLMSLIYILWISNELLNGTKNREKSKERIIYIHFLIIEEEKKLLSRIFWF